MSCDYDIPYSRMLIFLPESCNSIFRKTWTSEGKIVNMESSHTK